MSLEVVVGVTSLAGALGGVLASASGITWWFAKQFEKNRTHTTTEVANHERIDQARHQQNIDRLDRFEDKSDERHLENLERFNEIDVRLARMGNGSAHDD
jgi:hypothetical protein